jgi:hypothetical protein
MFGWFRKKQEEVDPLQRLYDACDEVNDALYCARAKHPEYRLSIWTERCDTIRSRVRLIITSWQNRCAVRIHPESEL